MNTEIKYNKETNTITTTTTRELKSTEFYCEGCNTVHEMSVYACAQTAMGHDIIFTCKCGTKTELKGIIKD